MGVSAVIVNFDGGDDLGRCLAAVDGADGVGEVVVVDNGSTDGSLGVLGRFPAVRLLAPGENLGFAGGVNYGIRHTTGDVVLALNPDTVLHPGCAAALGAALRARPGVAGPVLDVVQAGERWYGGTVDLAVMPSHLRVPGHPLFIQGCALAANRAVLEHLGGMDERYWLFSEDIELCWRALLAGYEVATVLEASATHGGGGSIAGGYGSAGRFTTSDLRLSQRERNSLAMVLVCASARLLPVLVVLSLARTLGTAVLVALVGRRRLAVTLLGGLRWNAAQLPATLRRRRTTPRSRAGERAAERRLQRGLMVIGFLGRYGLPRFADQPPRARTG